MALTAACAEDLELLGAVVDRLAAAGPGCLAEGSTLVGLQRQLARLDAVVTRAVGMFDAERRFDADDAHTASAWLAARCRLPRSETGRRVKLARKLRHMPLTEAGWVGGEINNEHVRVLAKARHARTAVEFDRDEWLLVDHARTAAKFHHFTRAVAYWCQLADPDGAEETDEARRQRRDVSVSTTIDGMLVGSFTLDPVSAAILLPELKAREAELYAADVAEATERLGRKPSVWDLRRSAAQRRADALVEMATRSKTPGCGQRPVPLFTVLVDFDTLHGRVLELANSTVIAPGTLAAWIREADLERAVFHSPTRIEVSETARLFTGGTRRAVEIRDRECTHPMCDQLAEDCQVDHIIPDCWDGPTTQANAQLLCKFHNRRKARRERRATKPAGDGTLWDNAGPPPN